MNRTRVEEIGRGRFGARGGGSLDSLFVELSFGGFFCIRGETCVFYRGIAEGLGSFLA